jgi:Protein of unknown function (DUF2568)
VNGRPGEGLPPTAGVGVLLAARFALEVLLLTAYAVIGTALVAGWLGWVVSLALVLLVAGLWGTWLAPKRRIDAPRHVRIVLELVLFVGAGIGLALVGHPQWGGILVAAEVIVLVLLRRPGEHVAGRRPG